MLYVILANICHGMQYAGPVSFYPPPSPPWIDGILHSPE
jgi:hypothetical protein